MKLRGNLFWGSSSFYSVSSSWAMFGPSLLKGSSLFLTMAPTRIYSIHLRSITGNIIHHTYKYIYIYYKEVYPWLSGWIWLPYSLGFLKYIHQTRTSALNLPFSTTLVDREVVNHKFQGASRRALNRTFFRAFKKLWLEYLANKNWCNILNMTYLVIGCN